MSDVTLAANAEKDSARHYNLYEFRRDYLDFAREGVLRGNSANPHLAQLAPYVTKVAENHICNAYRDAARDWNADNRWPAGGLMIVMPPVVALEIADHFPAMPRAAAFGIAAAALCAGAVAGVRYLRPGYRYANQFDRHTHDMRPDAPGKKEVYRQAAHNLAAALVPVVA